MIFAVLAALVPVAAQGQAAAEQTAGIGTVPADDSLRVSIGATYAEGRYGQAAQTRVTTIPLSVKYTHSHLSLKVSVPYVHIHGPGTLLDGSGSGASGSGSTGGGGSSEVSEQEIEAEAGGTGTDTGTGEGEGAGLVTGATSAAPVIPAPMRNRGGLGDMTVTLGYALPLGDMLSLEPRGRIKLPTASSGKGIGTGKIDATLSADLVGTFGPTSVYVGARRRFLGRSVKFPVRDGGGFGGGASHRISPGLTIGADYDWLESATPARGPISEASLWASIKLNHEFRLQAYAGKGFSSRSADALGGLTLVWRR